MKLIDLECLKDMEKLATAPRWEWDFVPLRDCYVIAGIVRQNENSQGLDYLAEIVDGGLKFRERTDEDLLLTARNALPDLIAENKALRDQMAQAHLALMEARSLQEMKDILWALDRLLEATATDEEKDHNG